MNPHRSEQAFFNELRETRLDGQLDMWSEMEIPPVWRPGVRCKKCGKEWRGEDSRPTIIQATKRSNRTWFVNNQTARCPECLGKDSK